MMFGEACRVCGCTEGNACPGGCAWADDDLCTQCATSVALIACSKGKQTQAGRPEVLYTGRLLQAQLAYARRVMAFPDERIFILSAKYGLLPLSEEIEPYDLTLAQLSVSERNLWAFQVVNDLLDRVPGVYGAFVMAGKLYRTAVGEHLAFADIHQVVPHPTHYGIGQQLAWYKGALQ